MKFEKRTINKLIVLGSVFALAGALLTDLTGNTLPLFIGLFGLAPIFMSPSDE